MRSLLKTLIGCAFSILLMFGVLELSIRILKLDQKALATWSDRPDQYYVRAGAKSMLDHNHSNPKTPGTFRVAVVGDSFSFAPYMQADDTFAKRLERWWNVDPSQKKVEVINYGVPRYSTSHEVAVTKQALAEEADLIILQITLNDPEIKPYVPTALIESDRFGQAAPTGWFFENIKTAKFIAARIANLNSVDSYKKYFFKLWESPESYANFKLSLKKIVKLTREKNVPVYAVVFPLFGFPNDKNYPFHPIHAKVKETLDHYQVQSLDLFPSFENIPLDRLVVLPGRDRHPNEIAHRIAAESINTGLRQVNLIN